MPTYREKKQKLRQLIKQQEEERIRKIQEEGYQFNKTDAFRVAEKHYKYYVHRKTDFSTVVDPLKLPSFEIDNTVVYQIPQPKGAFLIKKFMNEHIQYQIGFQAMNDYVRKPYRNNLDGTNGLYFDTQQKKEKSEDKVQEIQSKNKPQNQLETTGQYHFNQKIRMANLGYQYDWPHRSYPQTKVPIPNTIRQLTSRAQQLYQKIKKEEIQYRGEAVIVNYYKCRDYMIGHLDDGEQDQINPIFSFCFGLSCIFLLGFPTKERQPIALKLDAGDLLIMSGYSRICYHGVPRIIEESYNPPDIESLKQISQNIDQQKDQIRVNGCKQICNYFLGHRLNINVRQVWSKKEPKVSQSQKAQ